MLLWYFAATAMVIVTGNQTRALLRRLCDDHDSGGSKTSKSERASVGVGSTSVGGNGRLDGSATQHISIAYSR